MQKNLEGLGLIKVVKKKYSENLSDRDTLACHRFERKKFQIEIFDVHLFVRVLLWKNVLSLETFC